eukprot:2342403-Amphidinium_carterae.1
MSKTGMHSEVNMVGAARCKARSGSEADVEVLDVGTPLTAFRQQRGMMMLRLHASCFYGVNTDDTTKHSGRRHSRYRDLPILWPNPVALRPLCTRV